MIKTHNYVIKLYLTHSYHLQIPLHLLFIVYTVKTERCPHLQLFYSLECVQKHTVFGRDKKKFEKETICFSL